MLGGFPQSTCQERHRLDPTGLHQHGHDLFLIALVRLPEGEAGLKLKLLFAAACVAGSATAPALAADYDVTDKSPLVEMHLRIPATAMTIAPLKDQMLALYKADADQAKSDAKDDKEDNPSFQPYSIDTIWRVTFESDAVLSVSAETNADTGAAHPKQGFQTLVGNKQANRAVPIEALFPPDQTK